ncbi:MAG: hypothetical protein AB1410_08490 [Acidobacteriota bacterium]
MELIISGNPNLRTIRSVIYFAHLHYNQQIEKVYFIDSEGFLYDRDSNSLEGQRNEIVRKYIKSDVKIESRFIKKEDLHQEIPRLLSEQLRIYDKEQIVVDLTNGTKYISNILYASASLSKIRNLFFLFIPSDKQYELPENLNKDDYIIDVISPLESLESIGKHAYFEIIYYKDKAEAAIRAFRGVRFRESFLKNNFEFGINSAIDNYFLGKYPETIGALGQIVESFSLETCPKIKQLAKGKITAKSPPDFNDSISWLRSNFCDPIRGKRNKNLDDYEEELKLLQNIDKIIDFVRVYRNLSSHPYPFLRGQEEARMILNATFYLLTLIRDSGVLK